MSALSDSLICLPNLDMKEGESLEKAIANLTQLEQQFSKICSNLDQRLANLKGKLGQVNQRVGVSRQKIDTLKNLNQAITIVSPSKFVKGYKKGQDDVFHKAVNAEVINNKRIPAFDYQNLLNLNMNIKPAETDAAGRIPPPVQNKDEELHKIMKLTKGGLKPKRELFAGTHAIQNHRSEGLGRIPRDIKFIDSLVVFNSRANPYQNYQYINNTESNIHRNLTSKKTQKNKGQIDLTDAPKTLVEGDVLQQFRTEEHRFIPAVKELPQLNVRAQLDLHGIVNLAMNNTDLDGGMAPSLGGTIQRQTISDPKFLNEPNNTYVQSTNLSIQRFSMSTPQMDATPSNANANPSQSSNANYSFAPTITQNPTINVQRGVQVSNPQPTVNVNASNPTPQNQPAPGTSTEQATAPTPKPAGGNRAALLDEIRNPKVTLKKAEAVAPAKPAGGSRAALLDEIRNPKIKLKKAEAVEKKAPMERQGGSGKPEAAMSHMDHLKAQIQRRFEALNKNKEKKKKRNESSDEDDDDD